jgi:membrane protein DedA with SNARE-associated domain
MGKFILYTIIVLVLNVVLLFILGWLGGLVIDDNSYGLDSLVIGLVIFAASLIIQLVAGSILIAKGEKKELGRAMLLSVGIILLTGFSICSGIWR